MAHRRRMELGTWIFLGAIVAVGALALYVQYFAN